MPGFPTEEDEDWVCRVVVDYDENGEPVFCECRLRNWRALTLHVRHHYSSQRCTWRYPDDSRCQFQCDRRAHKVLKKHMMVHGKIKRDVPQTDLVREIEKMMRMFPWDDEQLLSEVLTDQFLQNPTVLLDTEQVEQVLEVTDTEDLKNEKPENNPIPGQKNKEKNERKPGPKTRRGTGKRRSGAEAAACASQVKEVDENPEDKKDKENKATEAAGSESQVEEVIENPEDKKDDDEAPPSPEAVHMEVEKPDADEPIISWGEYDDTNPQDSDDDDTNPQDSDDDIDNDKKEMGKYAKEGKEKMEEEKVVKPTDGGPTTMGLSGKAKSWLKIILKARDEGYYVEQKDEKVEQEEEEAEKVQPEHKRKEQKGKQNEGKRKHKPIIMDDDTDDDKPARKKFASEREVKQKNPSQGLENYKIPKKSADPHRSSNLRSVVRRPVQRSHSGKQENGEKKYERGYSHSASYRERSQRGCYRGANENESTGYRQDRRGRNDRRQGGRNRDKNNTRDTGYKRKPRDAQVESKRSNDEPSNWWKMDKGGRQKEEVMLRKIKEEYLEVQQLKRKLEMELKDAKKKKDNDKKDNK